MENFLDNVNSGYDEMGISDITIPFLRILQSLSPQCTKGSEEFIKGAEPGMFLNSVSNRIYGEALQIIPIKYEKTWLEFKPNRGGFVASHAPETIKVDKTNFSKWTNPANGNEITETVNYYCILPEFKEDGILILSLSSASLKYAKAWNSQIMSTRLDSGNRAPFFSSVWTLSLKHNKNDRGSWYSIGAGSSSATERERFITQDEYSDIIVQALKDVESISNKVSYDEKEVVQILSESDVKQIDDNSSKY